MRVRSLSLVSLFLTGCLHASAPAAQPIASATPCPALAPAPSAPDAGPAVADTTKPAPREVVWTLRMQEGAPEKTLPTTLHSFSLGRWECALSDVRQDEQAATRRLACTHTTGATVQSTLRCARDTQPQGATEARELELSLDSATPLHLRCEPRTAGS